MKTSVFVGCSVDGYIARHSDAFDFLAGSEGERVDNGFEAFFSTVDAVVVGRRTYEVVLPFPVWPYGRTPVFVWTSHRLAPAPAEAVVEPCAGTPADVYSLLQARGFAHVYVDGGQTIQGFLRAGLIDRIVMTRVPVLIGDGVSLFGELDGDARLLHVATRVLNGGAVQSEYLVAARAAASPGVG
jgi:dihydrofolate reductase